MQIYCTIEGVSPLLMNRFTEEAEMSVSTTVKKVTKSTKGTPREQAEKKAYKDEKGVLYIPSANVYAAIIQAGKFMKLGKSKVTTTKSSLIPAAMVINEMVCSLNTKDFEVDSRSVVIPSTGGRIMAHRPRLDEWKLSFSIDLFDEDILSADIVRMVIDDAGRKIGLGDFRPDRKGPFGRFVVTNWKVEKDKKAA